MADLDDSELDEAEDQDALVDPLEAILANDPSPLPALAPDGGFVPAVTMGPEPIPPVNAQNSVCLRGPCRHYMEKKQVADVGNTKGTFARPLIATNRFCHRIEGYTFDLMDEPPVIECSDWHPMTVKEVARRDAERDEFSTAHPEFTKGNSNGANS